MLPHINSQDRDTALAYRVVLVGRGHDLKFSLIDGQPSPAASEQQGRDFGKVRLWL